METQYTKLVSMVTDESEIKQEIVDLAYRKFSQHGFRKVTMDEIAAELGISKKTVYKHFESKEAILEEIVEQRIKRGQEALKSLLSADGSVDERIKQVAEMFPRIVDPDWQRLISGVVHTVPSVARKIQTILKYFITEVVPKILREGQREGTVRKDLNVDLFTVAYLGAAKEVFNSDFLQKHPVTEEVIPKQLMKIFMEGVLVRK
ncbi:MAG TPA: TetR/AcrR family transcriptional regulator [Candidatus Acidoferrales bacterium]|nr:TetR/AcrR family transcriptional regulator [Candidatus Acidoferrales bacterium]